MFLYLWLYFCFVNEFITPCFFRFHKDMSLSDLFHSVWQSILLLQMGFFHSFCDWIIFHYICVHAYSLTQSKLPISSVTPWTKAHQAPLSMGFPRQVYQNRLSFPSSGNLSNLGIEPKSPAFTGRFLPATPPPPSHQRSSCHAANMKKTQYN